jgi:hypothetical protein
LVYPLRKAPDIPKLLAEAARAAQAVVVAAAERLSRPQLRERMRTARHCRAAVQQALDAGWVEHWGSPVPVDRGEASLTALSYASQNAFRAWLVPGTAFHPEQEVAALQELADMMERADDSGVLPPVEVDGTWLTSPDDGLNSRVRSPRSATRSEAANPQAQSAAAGTTAWHLQQIPDMSLPVGSRQSVGRGDHLETTDGVCDQRCPAAIGRIQPVVFTDDGDRA